MVDSSDAKSTPFSKRFSRALSDLESEGVPQAKVAARLGYSDNTITSWKRGHFQPRLKNLKAIAATLEIPLGEFLTDESPSNAKEGPSAEELVSDLAGLDLLGPLEALVEQKRSLQRLARKSDDLIAVLKAIDHRRHS